MEDIKKLALNKMLQEMNEKHSASEDRVHNWLCDQDDESLMQNILKEGKSIKGALSYAKSKAQKEAENGSAMIDDDVVYGWVKEYYASDSTAVKDVSEVKSRPLSDKEKKSAAANRKKRIEEEKKAAAEKAEKERIAEEKAHQKELKKLGIVEGQSSIFDDLFKDGEAKA